MIIIKNIYIYILYFYFYLYSNGEPNAVRVHFKRTPPMSTFTLGLIIADLKPLSDPIQYKDEYGTTLGKEFCDLFC